MPDLRELYQELIVDHSKRPRNFGKLDGANQQAVGYNPLCGDKITVYLKMKDDVVEDVHFEGSGCAISTASASMMTEKFKGKTRQEAEELFEVFHHLVTGGAEKDSDTSGKLGKLAVFAGVSEFPVRVKCATLAWHTVRSAMRGEQALVSTE
ncbi:MAG: SUF system NifU family Fe-S cluster assembly protein [Acidobacteria bacterium]|nr:SUF system NifU family Fe-S cluster assembly protein [Acidobacteriota bacterium]